MSKTVTSLSRPPLTGHPKRLSLQMARYHKRSLAPRDLPSEPRGCNSSFKSALAGAGLSEAQGSDGVVVLVRRAAKWGAALYDIVSSTQGTVTVQVGENRWTVPRIGPTAVATSEGWLNALGAAHLVRDTDSIETLGRVGYQLIEKEGVQYAAHNLPTLLAFRSFARCDEPSVTAQLVQDALSKSTDASLSVYGSRVGQLKMLSALLADDPAGFQTLTVEALQWYRDYIVEYERDHSHEKLLPWLLLGLAARAHDRGWSVEVSSDYYPHWLVAGQPQPA